MYLNSFSVRVPEGTEKESGYVELNHGKQYALLLRNGRNVRCDADVTIDGKPVGTFRIAANSSLSLERPPNEDKRFTFYKADTSEAKESGQADIPSDSFGLIQVTFRVEKAELYVWHGEWHSSNPWRPHNPWITTYGGSFSSEVLRGDSAYTCTLSDTPVASQAEVSSTTDERSAGITGLSGHSDQEFVAVGPMDYDESYTTTISIRLVATEAQRGDPTPLKPVTHHNPVPPTVYA